jgi:hypothetical protein
VSAPAPSTEKPATEKPKRAGRPAANPEADKVDLSALEFTVTEKPKRKGAGDNPFTKPLGDSYETETARATTIPAVALKRVEGLLRRAAGELKIGVSIAATEPDSDGKVTITFMGKDRRKRKGKDGEVTLEAPAENTTEGDSTPLTGDAPSSDTEAASTPATVPAANGASAESVPATV